MDTNSTHPHQKMNFSQAEMYFEAAFLIFSSSLGSVGNAAIILLIIKKKSLQKSIYILLGNMSIAGLLISCVCIPLHVTTIILNENVYSLEVCMIESHFTVLCTLSDLLSLTLVAVIRYLAVAYKTTYKKLVSVKTCLCVSGFVWILAGALDGVGVGTQLLTGEYSYLYSRCSPINKKILFKLVVVGVFVIGVPFAIMSFCYVRLVVALRLSIRALDTAHSVSEVRRAKLMKMTRILIVISVLYLSFWISFLFLCGLDRHHNHAPLILHRLGHDCAEVFSVFITLIYALCVKGFRATVLSLFRARSSRVQDTVTVSIINMEAASVVAQQRVSSYATQNGESRIASRPVNK